MGDNDKDPNSVFVCLRNALNLEQQFSDGIKGRAVQVKKDEVVLMVGKHFSRTNIPRAFLSRKYSGGEDYHLVPLRSLWL